MSKEPEWFYPLCGYQKGWCLREGKCPYWDTGYEFLKCKDFTSIHPMTKSSELSDVKQDMNWKIINL